MKCKERTLYRPHTPQFWSQGTEPLIPNPLHCVEYCVGAALFWLPTQILICKMLIKSEIKAEKNQTWPQCAEGTGGTCAPRCGEVTHTQLLHSSPPTPHWPGAPPKFLSCLHEYFTQEGPREVRGRHTLTFQDGQHYLLQAPVSRAMQRQGHCRWCCWLVHLAISWVNNPSSNNPVSYWVRRFPKPTTKTLLNSVVMITSGQGSLSLPSTTRLPNQGYYWLRRDQRSEMALNRLEVGNKSPWHPIPTLCDATG